MTKIQTALTSLIAVIPALILALYVVMAMLFNSENLTAMAYIFLVVTLLASVATILIPGLILYEGKARPEVAKIAGRKESAKDSEDIEAIDDDVEVSESASHGSSGSFDAQDVLLESSEIDIGDSDRNMGGIDSEIDVDTEPVEDLDDFDLEEIEEEEVKPKSKKKKR